MTYKVIPLKVQYAAYINYTYLVIDEITKQAISVDPAWEMDIIERALEQEQARLVGILLTHHHNDHTHLAEPLAETFNVPVLMSQTEAETYDFTSAHLQLIKSDSKFQLGALSITPHFTPGHTSGCICYEVGDNLFTGDTLFAEGCGACLGQGADPAQLFHSLQYLKRSISAEKKIYPGHSYGVEIGQQFKDITLNNLYLNIVNPDDFIAFRMRKGQKKLLEFH